MNILSGEAKFDDARGGHPATAGRADSCRIRRPNAPDDLGPFLPLDHPNAVSKDGRRLRALRPSFETPRKSAALQDEVGETFAASRAAQAKSACIGCDKTTRRANHQILSSPLCKNILIFRRGKSVYILVLSCSVGGALAIVTNVEQDAMDAAALLTNSANADGKTMWSRRPDAGVQVAWKYPRGDGGKKARSPRRARYKP